MRYRAWLGFGHARFLPVPMPLMRLLGRVGDIAGDGPISTNSLAQMVAGNAGDGASFADAIGFSPRASTDALLARPAQVQDRGMRDCSFSPPPSKQLSCFFGWHSACARPALTAAEEAQQVAAGLGLPASWADPLRLGGSLRGSGRRASAAAGQRRALGHYRSAFRRAGIHDLDRHCLTGSLARSRLVRLLKNLPILLLIAVHGAIGVRR